MLSKEEDEDEALQNILEGIKARVERKEQKSTVVDVQAIEAVVLELSKDVEDLNQVTIFFIYTLYRILHISLNI